MSIMTNYEACEKNRHDKVAELAGKLERSLPEGSKEREAAAQERREAERLSTTIYGYDHDYRDAGR